MIIHHIVTILLIYFSWACNFVRVGSLVIVVHDLADPWLSVSTKAFLERPDKGQNTVQYSDQVSVPTA